MGKYANFEINYWYMLNEEQIRERMMKSGVVPFMGDRSLYKYVTIETAEKILSGSSIKFSTPSELNDKDLEMGLLDMTEEKLLAIKTREYRNSLKRLYNYSDTQCDEYLKSENGISKFDGYSVADSFHKSLQSQTEKIGIFCSTTSCTNSAMWESKYTGNGSGVCIGYKFPVPFNEMFMSYYVNYPTEFKGNNLLDESCLHLDRVAIMRWLVTKRIEYKLENEVRMILTPKFQPNVYEVPLDYITGLYYQKEAKRSDIMKLEDILKKKGYGFKKGIQL